MLRKNQTDSGYLMFRAYHSTVPRLYRCVARMVRRWLAKIQFLPAVLALNVGVVLF